MIEDPTGNFRRMNTTVTSALVVRAFWVVQALDGILLDILQEGRKVVPHQCGDST